MGKNRFIREPNDCAPSRSPSQATFEEMVRHPEKYSTRIKFRTMLKPGKEFKYSTDLLRSNKLEVILRQGDVESFKAKIAATFPDGTLDGFTILVFPR